MARQGDTQPLLPPPRLPALPPPQPALPIWPASWRNSDTEGRGYHLVKRTRQVTLGGEQRVLPAAARQAYQAIHEAVASLARRGKL